MAKKEVYKIFDTDDYAVVRCVYDRDTLLDCWRKKHGKEKHIFETSYNFAFRCFMEVDPCTKEFYDNYQG